MNVTFIYEDKVVTLQLAPSTIVQSLPAILQADFSISPSYSLHLYHNNVALNPTLTLADCGIRHQDVIEVTKELASAAGGDVRQLPSQLWLNPPLLQQTFRERPQLLEQIRHDRPLLEALTADGSERLAQLLQTRLQARMQAEEAERRRLAVIASDDMSAESQRLIEEEIRAKNIQQNMETAIEHSPESFGSIIMLYVPMIVNGHPLQAFVDSGAQSTIMSRQCAERCGIMRLCDTRFAGVAKGVGTARILGRVHSVKVQVGSVFFLSSFTILDNDGGTDFLFGLDQLRKHRSCIDLEKNVLRLLGQEIQFLAEKDLPPSKRGNHHHDEEKAQQGAAAAAASSSSSSSPASAPRPAPASPLPPAQPRPPAVAALLPTTLPTPPLVSSQPTVSMAPRPASILGGGGGSAVAAASPAGGAQYSEQSIRTLMELGFQRSEAIRALTLHRGNEEQAASFLFSQQFGL